MTGIIIVSFGSRHLDSLEKTIGALEREVQEQFADAKIYRALTSKYIVKKLREAGMQIFDLKGAIEQCISDQIEEVYVQPSYVINGIETELLREELRSWETQFPKICLGKPLLTDKQDYEDVVQAIKEKFTLQKEEALVLMGHGSEHFANAAYCELEYHFQMQGDQKVFVGTVEGYPGFAEVSKRLKKSGAKKVLLMSLVLVAGEHVKNDMAGEKDSWKSRLLEQGYQVTCLMQGLGEKTEIREIYRKHLKNMIQ